MTQGLSVLFVAGKGPLLLAQGGPSGSSGALKLRALACGRAYFILALERG